MAKTEEAFNGIYRFRNKAIEPAGLRESGYQIDLAVINEQRDIHQRLLASKSGSFSDEQILDSGPQFHEALVAISGNSYFLQTLQRVNCLRKLMEYHAKVNRGRLELSCTEHLLLLDVLEQQGPLTAADQLQLHLEHALEIKVPRLAG